MEKKYKNLRDHQNNVVDTGSPVMILFNQL